MSLPPRKSVPPLAFAADGAPAQALLPNSTAVQQLSAQLTQMAGQLRRNAKRFSQILSVG